MALVKDLTEEKTTLKLVADLQVGVPAKEIVPEEKPRIAVKEIPAQPDLKQRRDRDIIPQFETGKGQSFLGNLFSFTDDPERARAKSANAMEFSARYNISPYEAFELHDELARQEAERIGVGVDIPESAMHQLLIPPLIGGTGRVAFEAARATFNAAKFGFHILKGFGAFTAINEATSIGVSLKEKRENIFFQGRGFSDLLPDEASKLTEDTVDALQFMGEALLTGVVLKTPIAAKRIVQRLTQEIITKEGLPQKIYISPERLRTALQEQGGLSATEESIVAELKGLKSTVEGKSVIRQAAEKGVNIEVEASRISIVQDRPWFAKIKSAFGLEKKERVIDVEAEKVFKFGEKEVKAKTPEEVKLLTDAGGKPSVKVTPKVKPEVKPLEKPKPITTAATELKSEKKPELEPTFKEEIKELYADAIEIADKAGDRVEVRRLQDELKFIGGTITAPSEMRKLRQTIHAFAAFKGLSKKQLTSLTKDVTGHLKTTHKDITAEQLKKLLAKVKTARPKTIGHKTVITRKTEKRIQTLKDNLIARDEITDEAFKQIMKSMKISTPKYINSKNFITETQGKELIDAMLKNVPLIKDQIKVDKALKENPVIKKGIEKITTEFKKIQGDAPADVGGVKQLLDMHHFVDSMEKQTGESFGRTWEKINDKRRELDVKIDAQIDRVQAAGDEDFKKITGDEEALKRINDFIASKLSDHISGKPTLPKNITKSEKAIANEIIDGLKGFEADVRYNRFYQWREKGVKIPNAPQSELTRATEILETQGDKALRDWLRGRDWGIIKSGYDIGEVIKPTVKSDQRRAGFGSQHLSPRESVIFQRYERDILQRYGSYVRQMTYRTEMKTDIDAWVKLFELNKNKFINPSQTADLLTRNITELLNQRQLPAVLEEVVIRLYSQAARTIFLDVRKGARNLFQNLAFYNGVEDMFKLGKMSPADLKYFETHVSQNKGIQRDWLYQQYRGIPGLGSLNKIADEINVMGRTDTINRTLAFRAKLGSVRRALKNNPEYKTDTEAMANLQRDVGFSDIQPMERIHALKKLAIEGENAFARYIARAITQKVHFLYERIQRSPAEQGNELSRLLSNLLTFRKGYAQRLILDVRKLAKSQKEIESEIEGGRGKTLRRSIIGMFITSAIASYIYAQVTGDERDPYAPHQILGDLSLGGLATGAQQQVGDFTRDTILAITGDKDALSRSINNLSRSADMFIPFYDEVMNAVEGMSGYQNVDKAVLRQLRGALDSRINSKPLGFYEKERNAIESGQHIIFGTDSKIKKSLKKETTKKGLKKKK